MSKNLISSVYHLTSVSCNILPQLLLTSPDPCRPRAAAHASMTKMKTIHRSPRLSPSAQTVFDVTFGLTWLSEHRSAGNHCKWICTSVQTWQKKEICAVWKVASVTVAPDGRCDVQTCSTSYPQQNWSHIWTLHHCFSLINQRTNCWRCFSPLLNYELLYADLSVNDSPHWLEEVDLAIKLTSSLPLRRKYSEMSLVSAHFAASNKTQGHTDQEQNQQNTHFTAVLLVLSLDSSQTPPPPRPRPRHPPPPPWHKQARMQTNRQASKPCVHTQTVLIRGQAWLKVSLRFCHQGNPAKTNPTAGRAGPLQQELLETEATHC